MESVYIIIFDMDVFFFCEVDDLFSFNSYYGGCREVIVFWTIPKKTARLRLLQILLIL